MTKRQTRMLAVAVVVAGVSLAAALGFMAFRKNLMAFYTPTDLAAGAVRPGTTLQLGGLVQPGSLQRGEGLKISFMLADCSKAVPVRYDGVVPDLFREGQGAIATGAMGDDHVFVATRILAKHDEKYMPPNVANATQTADGKHACAPFKSVVAQQPGLVETAKP